MKTYNNGYDREYDKDFDKPWSQTPLRDKIIMVGIWTAMFTCMAAVAAVLTIIGNALQV